MQHRTGSTGPEVPASVAVEVLRPHDGQTLTLRSLSGEFGGLFVHYRQKRSQYCHPTECYPSCKRQQREWRGYTPVESWCPKRKLWFPGVLEVTEYLHVELADRWDAYQVWELYRPEKLGNKRHPTVPKFLRQDDGDGYPRPFQVLPVLKRLLGPNIRDLDERNPMPPRTYIAPSVAPPPVPEKDMADPEYVKRALEAFRNGKPMPNGVKK